MKFYRLCLLLFAAFLLAGCDTATTSKPADSGSSAEPASEESAAVNADASEEYVVDVRSNEEWDEGHLETAIHIPHTEIVEGIAKVTEDKNAKIYLH